MHVDQTTAAAGQPASQTPPRLATKQQIIDYLLSFDLFKGNEYEGYAYIHDAIGRLLITLQMVPPTPAPGARLLELGANPYFMTLLLQRLRPYSLRLANYFGPRERLPQAAQTIHSARYGETHTFLYDHFNVEHDDFPYRDNSFDVVLFCEILEHLTFNPTHTLAEIHRVLKPGGFVIVTTPNMVRWEHLLALALGRNVNDPYSGHGVYGRHNREYAPGEVVRLLRDCGFAVQRLRLANPHRQDAAQYLASGLRAHWCEHIFALAQATDLPPYRYRPWLYRSLVSMHRATAALVVVGENDELHTGLGWHEVDSLAVHAGRPVRWTQQTAEVFLRARGGENVLIVEVYTGPATLGAVEVTLSCAGASMQALPPADTWYPLRLPLAPRAPGEEVRLTIAVDRLRCPAREGVSIDPRSLGVMVRRALIGQVTDSVEIGTNDDPHLGVGWHEPEQPPASLRWTRQTAEVWLTAQGGESGIVVEAGPGPVALGPVAVTLRCGDATASFRLTEDAWTPLHLALPACEPGASVLIEIDVDGLRSPAAQGLSGDTRSLGVMVRKVALVAQGAD